MTWRKPRLRRWTTVPAHWIVLAGRRWGFDPDARPDGLFPVQRSLL